MQGCGFARLLRCDEPAGGYWQPALAKGIDEADAFVLLVGEKGLGPWQTLESYTLEAMWTKMVQRGDAVLRLPAEAFEPGGVLADRANAFLATHPTSPLYAQLGEARAVFRISQVPALVIPPQPVEMRMMHGRNIGALPRALSARSHSGHGRSAT